MPRSSRVESYPPEYEQLLLRAHEATSLGDGQFLIPLESSSAAHSLKAKVYSYFSALRGEATRPDLTILAHDLSLRVQDKSLCIFRKEDSWDAEALRSALGLSKGFASTGSTTGVMAPSSGQSEALEKLKAIRSRK